MALTLSYSVTERNDNLLLTVTDTSGEIATGTATGWGPANAVYTTIVASGGLHTLELDVTHTDSEGTLTTFDTIDLYTVAGAVPFAAIGDLVFELDCSDFKVSTVAIGTASDELPDGIYHITYVYDDGLGTEVSTTTTILLDGQVRNAVYELLRTLSDNYTAPNCYEKETLDIIFMSTLLDSMGASTLAAREQSVLDQLYTLERLVTNVSTYVW